MSCRLHPLFEEHRVVTRCEDVEDDQRQDPGRVEADPLREGRALAGIGFLDEVVPAPAVAARAEGQVDETAERQQVVRFFR